MIVKHLVALWVAVSVIAIVAGYAVNGMYGARAHQNDALHTIICTVESKELQNPKLTPKQRSETIDFWASVLQAANLPPCIPVE